MSIDPCGLCRSVTLFEIERELAGLMGMSTSPLAKGSKLCATVKPSIEKHNPTIEDFTFRAGLPTAEELPDSDGKPVDSELQELIPGLLKAILLDLWGDRTDWLFGIDLGFYYNPDLPPVAPDGFLSMGVEAVDDEYLRPSYVLWDEKVIPLFAVEIISKTAGRERTKKFQIYQSVGILYYLVYAPLRKRKAKFQLYKLIEGEYVLQSEGKQPYWMPEIGLGIGAEERVYGGRKREWLYWYDQNNMRYPTPTERAEQQATRAEQETERAEQEATERLAAEQKIMLLRNRLQELGIDPDSIT
jgi:Uma2 family endonuclease